MKKNNAKRFMAAALAILIVSGYFPAVPATWIIPDLAIMVSADGEIISCEGLISALDGASTDSENPTFITLGADINTSDSGILTVKSGTYVTLDLAGHKIDRALSAATTDGRVLDVEGNLTLIDSVTGGCITGGYASSQSTKYGGGVRISGSGTLIMNGGSVTGNKSSKYGGGIYVESGGTFTLNGGSVTNNQALGWDYGDGGGVYNQGTFTMNGGTISSNDALGYSNIDHSQNGGAGVYNKGTFTMNDGSISNNKVLNSGGGVWNSGTFYLQGGSISGNSTGYPGYTYGAGEGGGIYSRNTLYIRGGTISENYAKSSGGGVHMQITAKYVQGSGYVTSAFEMSGGTISGNSAARYGGGLGLYGLNSFFPGTFSISGGTITGNSVTSDIGEGGGLYCYWGIDTYNFSGAPVITGNTMGTGEFVKDNNLYLSSYHNSKLTVSGDISENAIIDVTLPDSYTGESFINNPDNHTISGIIKGDSANSNYFTAVTFDKNSESASGIMKTLNVLKNSYAKIPENTFERTGYHFNKWTTNTDGTGTSYAEGNTVTPTEAFTLYAQWQVNNYTVEFDRNTTDTVSGSMSGQNFTYDVSQALTANTFSREGYTFGGWNTEADGSGTAYTDGQEILNLSDENNGTVTLYARWLKNLTAENVTVTGLTYSGTAQEPTVKCGNTELEKGKDYTVEYSASLFNAGTYTATITGIGAYLGTVSKDVIIAQKPIAITAGSDTKIYDGTALTKNTYTNTDLASGDSIESVTVTGSQTNAGISDNVPSGAVIKKDGTDVSGNYEVTYVNGTLEVTQKSVTITADDKTKTYGEADPTLTATVSGTVGGDTVVYSVSRVGGEGAGTYAITPAGEASQGNYSVNYAAGIFTINAKEISSPTIEFSEDSFVYDGTEHKPMVTVKDGETTIPESEYTVAYSDDCTNAGSKTVTVTDKEGGNYTVSGSAGFAVTPSGDSAQGKYSVEYQTGTFTINAVPVTYYTVKFDANGHGKTPTSQSVKKNGKVTKPADLTADGYTFGGWFTDKSCTTEYNFNNPVTSSFTLYAKWTENPAPVTEYTVTFISNGGSGEMAPVEVEAGDFMTPECTFKAPAGKEFDKWQIGENSYNVGDIIKISEDTIIKALWKNKPAVSVNGDETTIEKALEQIENASGNVSVTITDRENISKLKFPSKGSADISISGDGVGTLAFKNAAAISAKADQKLTISDITIAAENNKAVTITSAKGGLTVENVTLTGKKATITATKGDLTLGNLNPDGKGTDNVTVKGAAKTTATIDGNAEVSELKGFGTLVIESNNTLTIDKTLNVSKIEIQSGAELVIKSGAKVTVKTIGGDGTIRLEKGFKPIAITSKASGTIKLKSENPLENVQIFTSKATNLNDVFDVSGIVPNDGKYALISKESKVTLGKVKFSVNGLGEYSDWTSMMTAITKKNDKTAVYTVDVAGLGEINIGSSFKLPTKNKYKGIIIRGSGEQTISFTGTNITLTGDLELDGVKVKSTKGKIKVNKKTYKLEGEENII